MGLVIFISAKHDINVVPGGPVAPVAPVSPVAPIASASPVAPVDPVSPIGPVAPVAPIGPVASVGPAKPDEFAHFEPSYAKIRCVLGVVIVIGLGKPGSIFNGKYPFASTDIDLFDFVHVALSTYNVCPVVNALKIDPD